MKHETRAVGRFSINRLNKPQSANCESFWTEVDKDVLDQCLGDRRRVVRNISFDLL